MDSSDGRAGGELLFVKGSRCGCETVGEVIRFTTHLVFDLVLFEYGWIHPWLNRSRKYRRLTTVRVKFEVPYVAGKQGRERERGR